jgi:multidrug efflux pump subunit AcrB
MNPIIFAMRHPITMMVGIAAVVLGAALAVFRMPIDIFPDLNTPVIYVAQPYGGKEVGAAAVEGAKHRLRPILMTSCAMIAGMVPMSLALGEGGEQAAPLARAVIGGLAVATLATLFILPSVFAVVLGRSSARSASIDPDDPESGYFDQSEEQPADRDANAREAPPAQSPGTQPS